LILKELPKLRALQKRMESGKECMKSYLHADLKKFKKSVFLLEWEKKWATFRSPFKFL